MNSGNNKTCVSTCVSYWLTLVSNKATHWQKLPSYLGHGSNLLSTEDSPEYWRNEFTLQLLFQQVMCRAFLLCRAAYFKERVDDMPLSNLTSSQVVKEIVSPNTSCFYRKWCQNQPRWYNTTMLKELCRWGFFSPLIQHSTSPTTHVFDTY